MRAALVLANVVLKLTMVCAFAHDGDMVAAGTILVLTPVTSWLIAA
jgi:hypothetical protein